MSFAQPIWFLLLLPLAVALWTWRAPTGLLQVLWIIIVLLIVTAMTQPLMKRPSRSGVVVVVADRSRSMPDDSQTREQETINLLIDSMTVGDRLAVVSYGERVVVERSPDIGPFGGFTADPGVEGSNLSDALDRALALIPHQTPGRVVVLSDGRWTGHNPLGTAGRAAERGVALDYRYLGRPGANDIAIDRIDAPLHVAPRESYMLTAWITSPTTQQVRYELLRDRTRIASGTTTLDSGLSRLTFRDRAQQAGGTHVYRLRITGGYNDPIPENNTARLLVGVEGTRPLLALTGPRKSAFIDLIQRGGINVHLAPVELNPSIQTLSNYAGLILENVPAQRLGTEGMENVAAWVTGSGAGLMMSGGRQSFGPGGYFQSPLDPILPVSMELRQEHRKLALAIVVVLDRSGSMTMPVGGKTKMDLANLGTAQVIDLLSPMDEIGVIAVDSSAHIIQKLTLLTEKEAVRRRVLKIQSKGGGIFVYTGLAAGIRMIANATAQTRHIILFFDAADSVEPGAYKKQLGDCAKVGITVSVIGLGLPTDVYADFLRDIAARGNGRIFFTNDATELPRLFAQDTFAVARSSFLDELTQLQPTAAMTSLLGYSLGKSEPVIGGYNLCYLRPGATLAALSVDEYKAPLIANWQSGMGRVICYTGEADGKYTGPIAQWPDAGKLFTSLARWIVAEDAALPNDMVLTQSIKDGVYSITVHLDPARPETALKALPTVTTLRGQPGRKPNIQHATMQWNSPDTLNLSMTLTGEETALATVQIPDVGKRTLSPVCLPYSPEYKPPEGEDGQSVLLQLAQATGGIERIQLAETWQALPKLPQNVAFAHWLLLAAIVLVLLEVIERRTGALSMIRRPVLRRVKVEEAEAEQPRSTRAVRQKPTKPSAKKKKNRQPAPSNEEMVMLDALRQARSRADQRTRKK